MSEKNEDIRYEATIIGEKLKRRAVLLKKVKGQYPTVGWFSFWAIEIFAVVMLMTLACQSTEGSKISDMQIVLAITIVLMSLSAAEMITNQRIDALIELLGEKKILEDEKKV